MNPFFEFIQNFNLFEGSRTHDRVTVENENVVFEFELFNSAPFSTRSGDDKRLHYLSQEELDSIRRSANCSVKIVLIHHDPNWFEDESKLRLEHELTEHCDLLFVGHEHDNYAESITYLKSGSQGKCIVVRGGVFDTNSYDESSFGTVVLDLEEHKLILTSYKWDRHNALFLESNKTPVDFNAKQPDIITPSESCLEKMNCQMDTLATPFDNLFVFPNFRIEIGTEDLGDNLAHVEQEKDLWQIIGRKKLVCVTGGQLSGKTALLKHLFLHANENGKSPLYMGNEHSKIPEGRIIGYLVEGQYGGSQIVQERFRQLPKQRKVLLIDDFDQLKMSKGQSHSEFLASLLTEVSCIVFTCRQPLDEDIVDRLKASFGSLEALVSLQLKDFYKDKRTQLIDKVCELSGATQEVIDDITAVIDRSVHNHRRLASLNPDFIIRSVEYYLEHGVSERAEEAPFNEIFEANVIKCLESAYYDGGPKPISQRVREALALLSEIAIEMHRRKTTSLEEQEVATLIKTYRYDYQLEESPIGEFFKACKKSGLLIKDERTLAWGFSSENYLAYFVARWLNTQQNLGNDVSEEIERLIEGICFNINENILLFLAYLRYNVEFSIKLCEAAEEAIDSSNYFSIDEGTIAFLSSTSASTDVKMLKESSRAEQEKVIAKQEEQIDNGFLVYRGPYEYDESDVTTALNRITRATKCLEMVGKSLVSQNEIIRLEKKKSIIEALFSVPNKILYKLLHGIDEHFDEATSEVLSMLQEDPKTANVTYEQVAERLVQFGLLVVLSLYDDIAFCCSNPGTGYLFQNETDSNDTNRRIQRLCMAHHSMQPNDFINYAAKAIEVAKKQNGIIEISAIRIMVNHYLSQHRGLPESLLQRCSQKVFDGLKKPEYQKLLIENRKRSSDE